MKTRMMAIAVAALALVVVMVLVAAGCSPDSNGTGVEIRPTWIAAQIEGEQVSISNSEVDDGQMVHFRVEQQGASMVFMAYRLGEEVYLRASICPPCRSENFSLAGDTLVCNTCGTRFQAATGDGISGACKGYPKAEAAFAAAGGRMTASITDLVAAYQNTKTAGRP
jgi:nitrite reductase/ring-hydroxylating ferredoxin subunit